MSVLKAVNSGVLFLAELAMLVAAGLAGWRLGGWPLLVLFPVVVIVAWAVFGAPRSSRRLAGLPLQLFRGGVFVLVAALLAVAGQWGWAVALGVVGLLAVILDGLLEQPGLRSS